MRENQRPYPPDYVSAETLAYRLECSRATIDAYVKQGCLPPPEFIGNLRRWDFAKVKAFITTHNATARATVSNGVLHDPTDPYLQALNNGPAAQR